MSFARSDRSPLSKPGEGLTEIQALGPLLAPVLLPREAIGRAGRDRVESDADLDRRRIAPAWPRLVNQLFHGSQGGALAAHQSVAQRFSVPRCDEHQATVLQAIGAREPGVGRRLTRPQNPGPHHHREHHHEDLPPPTKNDRHLHLRVCLP